MGVGEDFQRFCCAIRLSQGERSTISGRTAAISKRLNQDFWNIYSETDHRFYSGSYGRGTAISGVSDIDLLMCLQYSTYIQYSNYSGNGQSSLLQAVKSSIAKTYPTTSLKGDGQVVVVAFGNMSYDVVPVFLNTDGSYTHPDSNNGGSWKVTKPKEEISAFEQKTMEQMEICESFAEWFGPGEIAVPFPLAEC
ncbi:SMODS domain-containing nucleotidyltransferase [Magnetospirillum fulvum]|uniref:SMODS domain-containing nucleotidyltransferase n=1 Tax=Magnetospirillum fulvum TaxID=1082 RepID=UPI0018C9C21C|nr:hypothetical protein [Magnetospirillum fulvum]